MDKLIATEQEMFFDSPAATTTEKVDFEINSDKYREFLRINPIWNYFGLSKNEYFGLTVQEKTSYIQKYYKHMLDGKSSFFVCYFLLFSCNLV